MHFLIKLFTSKHSRNTLYNNRLDPVCTGRAAAVLSLQTVPSNSTSLATVIIHSNTVQFKLKPSQFK